MTATKPPLTGFLEKSAKYTKSWTKRYMVFDPETCKMEYGESSTKIKSSMILSKVTRCSEINPKIVAGSPDLYSLTVDGTLSDGKVDSYSVRCPDSESFRDWFFAIRNALGSKGSMDPFNYGLPECDPRTNLPLVHVPVEHLHRFHLLDRAIMYFFGEVEVFSSTGGDDTVKELMIIGDKCLYLFRTTADVHRCVQITSVQRVYAGKGALGISIAEPQHDIMIVNCLAVAEISHVLAHVLKAIPNTASVEIDTSLVTASSIAEQLHLVQRDGYKHTVTAPTPKMKLKAAMDVYEKQTGQQFVYGSAAKPAAVIPKAAVHHAPAEVDIADPMAVMLMKAGMNEYIVMLQRQHVDVDLLGCMEPEDLVNFGINNPQHRRIISAAARGEPLPNNNAGGGNGGASPVTSPRPAGVSSPRVGAAPIALSDSDDDLPAPVIAAKKVMAITLSSDDDDDTLPPPKPQISLESDDDLPPPQKAGSPRPVPVDDDI